MSIEYIPLTNEGDSLKERPSDAESGYEVLTIGETTVLSSIDHFDDFFACQVESFRTRGSRHRKPLDVSEIKGRSMWIDEFKKPKGVYGGSTGRVLCTKLDAHDFVGNLGPDTPSLAMNIAVEGLSSRRTDASISYLSSLDLILTPHSGGYAGDMYARYLNKNLKGNLKSFEREHSQAIENALALARLAIQNPMRGGRADGNK